MSISTGKNKEGVYYVHIRDSLIPNQSHQKKIENRKWRTQREARAVGKAYMLELSKSNGVLTYQRLYDIYLEEEKHRLKESTLTSIHFAHRAKLLPRFGTMNIDDITHQEIVKWRSELLTGRKLNGDLMSNGYIEKLQSVFKRVLNWAYKNYKIKENPYRLSIIKHKGERKKAISYYTPKQYDLFYSMIQNQEYETAFDMLYWLGIRIGELMALKVKDIDFTDNVVRIYKTWNYVAHIETTPKTDNSYRDIVMTDRVHNALQTHIQSLSKNYLYSRETYLFGFDDPYALTTFIWHLERIYKSAGLPKITLHGFRHSNISLLISLGYDAFEISKRSGNSVLQINNRYGHWFKESQQKMVNSLNDFERKCYDSVTNLPHDIKKST